MSRHSILLKTPGRQAIAASSATAFKPASLIVVGLAFAVAGCSTNIARFGSEPFGLNSSSDTITGSNPRPSAGLSNAPQNQQYGRPYDDSSRGGSGFADGGDAYAGNTGTRRNASDYNSRSGSYAGDNYADRSGGYTPSRSNSRSVEVAALQPPPSSSLRTQPPLRQNTDYAPDEASSRTYSDRQPSASYGSGSSSQPSGAGQAITVERGDTLYGLSRRHGVSVSELMSENGLTSSDLRPGQTLYLPGGSSSRSSSPARSTPPPAAIPPREAIAAASPPSDWTGTYEVASGDSLYEIAKRFGVRSSELQANNAITNPRAIRPGTILRVPGVSDGGSGSAASRIAEAPRTEQPRILDDVSSPARPAIINGNTRVAGLSPGAALKPDRAKPVQTIKVTPPAATAPEETAKAMSKLRWPARGKIIDGFGPRADGTHNDGVNVSLPMGAEVHAAEDGVVAYAGSELKGYGNLILVRHENGWVTAYAHADKLLVKRGDKITRGQVIAKAGRTGGVDQPQLHFELRQGAKPIDPLSYLEAL